MKNLLIVTSTFPKNEGDFRSARFVYDLALALREHYRVHVVAPHSPGAKTYETCQGIKIYRFRYFFPPALEVFSSGEGMMSDLKRNPLALLQVPLFLIAEFFAVSRVVRKENIDVVNSHWVVPQGLMMAFVRKVTGVPHITTAHAADVFLLKRLGAAGRAMARFIERNSDGILPVSSYIKMELLRLLRPAYGGARNDGEAHIRAEMLHFDNHHVVPMGVDTAKFMPRRQQSRMRCELGMKDKFSFLFVGKFVEKKGISVLLEAVSLLDAGGADFNLMLVGGGILEEELKSKASERGLLRFVRFMGWVNNDEMPKVYSASDVLVVPSVFDKRGETEGMPVVVNEALACGVPVLGSRISGIPDVVRDGYNGWLVRPGDAKELAGAMKEAIGMSDMEKYSRNAVQSASENRWENIARKYYHAAESARGRSNVR